MYKEYKIIAALGALIRFCCLPSNFQLAEMFSGNTFLAFIIVEPILQALTYAVVGAYYTKGFDSPIKGSVLYLIFYTIHTALYCVLCFFEFNPIAVVITIIAYFAMYKGINRIRKFVFGGV